jgi:hypothetical protein
MVRSLALFALAFASTAALAQAPTRIRGTLENIDGNVLTVKARGGETMKVTVPDNVVVVGIAKASLGDITSGKFIGTTTVGQREGALVAEEVHIFPEAMRGTGEGHRPYTTPGSTMTNGTAAGATVTGTDGSAIKVKYKDGEKVIVVPPNVPIVRYEIGSLADLKTGAAFTVLAATKKPDGSFEAPRINVGRDGVVPQ